MLFRKIHIRQQERGVWFRDGDFRRLLAPGDHQLWSRFWTGRRDVILPADTLATRFDHALLDVMLAEPHVRDALHVVDLTDVERALVWKDERLAYVLGPGRHAFWKTPYRLYVETFRVDAGNFWFQHPRLAVVLKHPDAAKWLDAVQVDAGAEVLLYRDGVLTDRLGQGLHVFWKGTAKVAWKAVDLREQSADVAGQEIITADKVPGDMKTLLNQVIAAQKESEANLIRRREETASVRSQANTAKLLAESPPLARLKELELLKEVLAGTSDTFVFGEGDLAAQVRSLMKEAVTRNA